MCRVKRVSRPAGRKMNLAQADREEGPTMRWPSTELTERLGIRYPIVQAPMAGATTPELVAAVSNAGGLGSLGAALLPPDELRRSIGEIRRLTDRPFNV